ncbi:uncharacterized protein FOMMEDRAFT_74624, partial [Fomitiporia mediterranea MF3/22]|uniref:uncharacterized protein n=1 Tax=Fomitiporia mediterranea (strain MF3/22) TaxID=694068 RepID=UPI0004409A7E
RPAILAMDEAMSSFHATSEYRVNDAIDKILSSKQTTCMIVALRISSIARAERIVVLEGGKITESGTYRQLVNTSTLMPICVVLRYMYISDTINLRTTHVSPP